ncbi:hypothetical protein JYU02_00715 [bacterium AH-315-P15]|nr:hypothetical protein [bacterium AH-315-P15]
MVKCIADTQEIEKHLIALCSNIVDAGGFIHKDLEVRARGGNLTIEAPSQIPNLDPIIKVPKELLLPAGKFDLRLDGNDFGIGTPDPSVSPVQLELMEHMLALYNLTGKMEQHRKISTSRLFFEDRELFDKIAFAGQREKAEAVSEEEFDLAMFLGSRTLGVKSDEEPEVNIPSIMPIVDFFNNNSRSAGYDLSGQDLTVRLSTPIEGSRECFVRYGKYDAQALLLSYDYVDRSIPFVTSVPMSVMLGDLGTIEILRNTGRKRQHKAPANLSDLGEFLPPVIPLRDDNAVRLPYLFVPPPNFPRSMRRILAYAIEVLSPSLSKGDISSYVKHAERQVIARNLEHYSDLNEFVSARKAKPGTEAMLDNVRAMIDGQLKRIKSYSFEEPRGRSV